MLIEIFLSSPSPDIQNYLLKTHLDNTIYWFTGILSIVKYQLFRSNKRVNIRTT